MSIEFGKVTPYEVHIIPTDNKGFIVRVGCFTGSYTSIERLISDLRTFLLFPEETEKEYTRSNRPVRFEPEGGGTGLGAQISACTCEPPRPAPFGYEQATGDPTCDCEPDCRCDNG